MNGVKEKTEAIGNASLVSNEEEKMAAFLRERNLSRVNAEARPVNPKKTIYTRYIKRMLDIIISAFALIVTLPLNLIFAICTFF